MKNPTPSEANRIFDAPRRCAASTGSKRTLYPAFMKASVGVDDQDELARGVADACLDGGAVPFVVRMTNHPGASRRRLPAGVIDRSIVDHEDLVPRGHRAQLRDKWSDRCRFVE